MTRALAASWEGQGRAGYENIIEKWGWSGARHRHLHPALYNPPAQLPQYQRQASPTLSRNQGTRSHVLRRTTCYVTSILASGLLKLLPLAIGAHSLSPGWGLRVGTIVTMRKNKSGNDLFSGGQRTCTAHVATGSPLVDQRNCRTARRARALPLAPFCPLVRLLSRIFPPQVGVRSAR